MLNIGKKFAIKHDDDFSKSEKFVSYLEWKLRNLKWSNFVVKDIKVTRFYLENSVNKKLGYLLNFISSAISRQKINMDSLWSVFKAQIIPVQDTLSRFFIKPVEHVIGRIVDQDFSTTFRCYTTFFIIFENDSRTAIWMRLR